MKCRHYRPESALSPFFSCRGHSPASAWRYRILLTDELTALFGLAHSSGSLSEWRLDLRIRARRSPAGRPRDPIASPDDVGICTVMRFAEELLEIVMVIAIVD